VGPVLAGLGFYVLAPELRGHGESPKPKDGYDTATLLADLQEVVPDEMDVLIGHSFGGFLAQKAVLGDVFKPRALVLEDPVSHQPDQETPTEMLAWDRAHLPRDIEGTLVLNPRWSRRDAAGKVLSLEQVDWDGARTAFAGNAPWDVRGAAARVAGLVATCWVLPGESRFVPAQDLASLIAIVSEEAVAVFPDAGHSIHRDEPDAFARLVASLYRRSAS
jgi:pimeloyl-ACP methyl ester carboxylesterase